MRNDRRRSRLTVTNERTRHRSFWNLRTIIRRTFRALVYCLMMFEKPQFCRHELHLFTNLRIRDLNETGMTLRAGTFFIRHRMIHNLDWNFWSVNLPVFFANFFGIRFYWNLFGIFSFSLCSFSRSNRSNRLSSSGRRRVFSVFFKKFACQKSNSFIQFSDLLFQLFDARLSFWPRSDFSATESVR